MLNGVFLISTTGDVLVLKSLTISQAQWSPEKFYQEVKKESSLLAPCINIDKASYLHCKSDDVYIVAVTEDKRMSPFALMESFNNFVRICSDLIGDLNAKNVLSHAAVVYELIIQMFGLSRPSWVTQQGIAQCKQMGESHSPNEKLFPFVPSNLFGVTPTHDEKYLKSSSASKAPLASGSTQHKGNEIFVDLIEYLTVIINHKGKVLHKNIEGSIGTKSYLSGPVDVQITLPEKAQENREKDAESISITWKRINSPSDTKEQCFPILKHVANPGFSEVMDYQVSTNDQALPFTMYHNFSKVTKGNLTELTLTCKLFCAMPSGYSPINWSAMLPLPSKLVSVSGRSTLQNITFTKDDCLRAFSMFSPIYPAQSHHSITVSMLLSEVLEFLPFEMPYINLQFEVPNLCVSNMKICGLKVQSSTSSSTNTINKWVRCVTHSKNYQLQLKSDFI